MPASWCLVTRDRKPGEIFLSNGISDPIGQSTNLSSESHRCTYPGPNPTAGISMTGLEVVFSGDGIVEEFYFYIMHACNVKQPLVFNEMLRKLTRNK